MVQILKRFFFQTNVPVEILGISVLELSLSSKHKLFEMTPVFHLSCPLLPSLSNRLYKRQLYGTITTHLVCLEHDKIQQENGRDEPREEGVDSASADLVHHPGILGSLEFQ